MGVEGQTVSSAVEMTGLGRRVLIIVENLPCPFDRRVWQEARTLPRAGYRCRSSARRARATRRATSEIDGIDDPPPLAAGRGRAARCGYALEYSWALLVEFVLVAAGAASARGFDVIHACNPPDTIFLIGGFYKLFGKKFVFDHHDINPELYEAKFGRRDFFYKLMVCARAADVQAPPTSSIATNESYRRIAIERGGMPPERVFVVRSGPNLERLKHRCRRRRR